MHAINMIDRKTAKCASISKLSLRVLLKVAAGTWAEVSVSIRRKSPVTSHPRLAHAWGRFIYFQPIGPVELRQP